MSSYFAFLQFCSWAAFCSKRWNIRRDRYEEKHLAILWCKEKEGEIVWNMKHYEAMFFIPMQLLDSDDISPDLMVLLLFFKIQFALLHKTLKSFSFKILIFKVFQWHTDHWEMNLNFAFLQDSFSQEISKVTWPWNLHSFSVIFNAFVTQKLYIFLIFAAVNFFKIIIFVFWEWQDWYTWLSVILDDPVDLTVAANEAVRPTYRRLW